MAAPSSSPPPPAPSPSAAASASGSSETTYSFAAVAKILDLGESKLRYWSQVGFVGPSVRSGGRQLFSFQDLISVKAAKELVDRGFSVTEIRRALDRVRASLPHVDRPLDRIRLAFDGESLVVVDDGNAYEVTGQKVFDFGLGDLASQASIMPMGGGGGAGGANGGESAGVRPGPQPQTSYDWFKEGMRIDLDPARQGEAEACYRKALALDPGLAAAHTNLGHLAYRRGDTLAARAAFEAALTLDPEQPEARFNLANLILESGDLELAVAELRRVLQTAPDFADAHYNLAVALERLGGRAQARAHLERYVRLDGTKNAPWAAEARSLLEKLADA
jgi:tetratricopeptide (TPR) repeat protein